MVWIDEDLTAMLYLSVENWNFSSLYKSTWFTLARNGITAPLFKAPTPFPDMPSSLNFFCFPNLFSIPPCFKAFYIVPPTPLPTVKPPSSSNTHDFPYTIALKTFFFRQPAITI